jgi:signal peptidase I
MRTWLFRILALVALAAGYWFFAPLQAPGGQVAYAVTDGTSMLPDFHTGDLVILRKAGSYHVGDNAGYHDPDLGNAIVFHRIFTIEDGKYTFKGINKTAPDSTSVSESAIVGTQWIHVPKVGKAFKWAGAPMHAAILVLVAVLLSFSGAGLAYFRGDKKPRRKRGGGESSGPPLELPAPPAATGLRTDYVLPVVGAVAAVFGLLTLIAFSTAKTRTVVVPDYASDTASFSYHATAPKTPVYPTGKIHTGDTVFAKQLNRGLLFLDFTYGISPKDPTVTPHSRGKVSITEHIEGDNLWKADRVIVPPMPLKPGTTTIHTHLDLDKLKQLLQQVEDETGYPASQAYKLTLKANIVQEGTAGSVKLNETFSPTMLLDFDKVRLYPDLGPTGTGPESFTTTQPIAGLRTTDASVDVKLGTLSVPTARIVGPVGLLVALLAVGILALRMRKRKESDEPTRIAAEYGDWLVPVTHMTEQSTQFADVASFEALASLASRADRAIMHYSNGTAHTYFVKEDDVVYRYTTYAKAPQPAPVATPLSDRVLPDAPDTEDAADAPVEDDFAAFADGVDPLPEPLAAEPAPSAAPEWDEPAAFEPPPPVVPVEELPSIAPVFHAAPAQPIAVPAPAPPAPAAPPAAPLAPAAAAGGFMPESPETAYQPAPLSMPPIVVPQQPAPAGAPSASGIQPIVPLAPITPAPQATPEVGLIRDTFLRPRPRQGDGNGNGSGHAA